MPVILMLTVSTSLEVITASARKDLLETEHFAQVTRLSFRDYTPYMCVGKAHMFNLTHYLIYDVTEFKDWVQGSGGGVRSRPMRLYNV